jgi:hypothetical protein
VLAGADAAAAQTAFYRAPPSAVAGGTSVPGARQRIRARIGDMEIGHLNGYLIVAEAERPRATSLE